MPHGLPFIARPGQEGFDAYGRMRMSAKQNSIARADDDTVPPELPEGVSDGGFLDLIS